MIQLRGVSKQFGKRWAVRELDLSVPRGEIFGLLGHNGAGKSTAIGMMLGQVWPTTGELRICGHDITRDRAKALHRVGAIFETPVFYDYLSGWKNLQILSHYTAPTPPERIKKIVEWVGLTGREHDKVSKYSHGMRTRLALAQALLPDPELLILDEPSDGLDPEGIHEMRLTIQRLQKELGLTILLSSHLLNEVELLCTRIAVLNQGKKVFEGTLADAKQTKQWVRLKVSDFAKATVSLQSEQLITDTRNGSLVALADGVKIDALIRRLVADDIPVFEVAQEEETLESFYLNLMQDSRAKPQELKG
ncbi:MAG: ABC transporter ATP-binding protein [Pedosphaera sp.]|nr:ABC transporter ATP-binding protein [Pedosphaera sp.]